MSHKSDKSNLSQLLRVETESDARPGSSNYFEDEKESYVHNGDTVDTDSLGPLPVKWEKAYTENGEAYFIE